jgi:hypothetical protein
VKLLPVGWSGGWGGGVTRMIDQSHLVGYGSQPTLGSCRVPVHHGTWPMEAVAALGGKVMSRMGGARGATDAGR